jgi:hypothetical protein
MFGLFFEPEDKVICPSQKSVDFQRITQRCIQDDMHFYRLVN